MTRCSPKTLSSPDDGRLTIMRRSRHLLAAALVADLD